MVRLEKLIAKIKNNPKNVRFETIHNLLINHGFEVRQPKNGSSHYHYKLGRYLLTIPRKDPVKEIYIKQAIKALEEME